MMSSATNAMKEFILTPEYKQYSETYKMVVETLNSINSTFVAQVRAMLPKATEEEISDALWGHTCFPFGPNDIVVKQLQEFIDLGPYDMITDSHIPWADGICPYV